MAFDHEVKVLKAMEGKQNIVKMVDYGQESYTGDAKERSALFIAFEQGKDFYSYLRKAGRFSEPVARYFFKEILNALDQYHQSGYAHRDIKP